MEKKTNTVNIYETYLLLDEKNAQKLVEKGTTKTNLINGIVIGSNATDEATP